MLSLGLGFGSMMEENELEEGEAFSYHADYDDCIDPDIALSYIDEKLQNVLGHFQKDFEGGVSAENLGAKFGGYGSFLPTYQRSPTIFSHPRSPLKPPSSTISKFPNNLSVECAWQNPSVQRDMPVSKIYSTSVAQPSSLDRKENGVSSLGEGGCVPLLNSNNKQVNGTDQKSLKVRIRVGPDNTLARSNTAIYSGLGLDTSPFSSPEDSPDACPRFSPKVRDALSDSPLSILQVMTCFSIPGGYFLSPLKDNFFQLTENGSLFSRKSEMLNGCVPDMCVLPNIKLPVREVKGFSDKKNKADELSGRSLEDGNWDATKMLKEIDTPASRRICSSELNMSHQPCSRGAESKAERQVIGDSAKGSSSSTLEGSKEHDKTLGKERFSLPDFAKDDQVISMENVKSGGFGTLGNGNRNLKSKTSLLEKEIEERNPNKHKVISSDTLKEGKSKNKKSYDIRKLSDVEYKSKNDHVAGHAEPMKHVPGQRVVSHKRDAEKAIQGNDKIHEGKLRRKGAHNNCILPTESIQSQENIRHSSSLVLKEKKKRSHAKKSHSENTSEILKSHKETCRIHSRESHRDVAGNTNGQVMESRPGLLEPFEFAEKSNGKLGVKKDVNIHPEPMENPTVASAKCAAPALDAAVALDALPLVIEEIWVCCDKCQTWRLLPYGADPRHLPKKWKCSMQVWLPGLNKCSISEDETTKAFNAMYLVPAPKAGAKLNSHNDVTASSITTADAQHFDRRLDHDLQNAPATAKKSSGIPISSKVPKNSVLKKYLQSSDKNRNFLDEREYPLDTNSSIKGCLGLTSKSMDATTEKHAHKQKEKLEVRGRYSDGGDFIEKSDKHSKSKGKKETHQDGLRTFKKFKKENLEYAVEDKLPNLDMADMTVPGMDGGLSAKATGKFLQNYSDHSSSKDSMCEPRGNLLASIKKSKGPVHIYSNGDCKVHVKGSNVEKYSVHDYAAKKRKMKEWQESQVHEGAVTIPTYELDSRLHTKEGELRKQKKAKVFKSEGKECSMNKVDGKMDKTGRSTKILLSGRRVQLLDGVGDEGRVGGKKQIGQYQESTVYQQALDGSDHLKSDTIYAQFPTAATSSSSKVSSSRKSKANFQEARGSPVESVSSSPLRTSTIEKTTIRRKTVAKNDIVNANLSVTGSRKRCSDGDFVCVQTGTRRKETCSSFQLKSLESDIAADSGFHGSIVGTYQYLLKEGCHLSSNKDEIRVKKGAQVDLSRSQSGERNAIGDTESKLDHDDKNLFEGTEIGNIDGDSENVHNHCYGNGTSQLKSGKIYSAFKEKNRPSNSDANKVKVDVSNSISNKMELYSSKNGSHFQFEPDFNCNDDTNYQEDLKKNSNFQEKENSCAKQSYYDRRDNLSSNGLEETLDAQNKETNSRVVFVGSSCEPKLQEDLRQAPSYRSENSMSRSLLDGIDRTETALEKGVSQPAKISNDKSEPQSSGSRLVHTPIKVSRSETCPIVAENGHAIKMVKQSRNLDSQNGANLSSLRQAIPNGCDCSPMMKDSPAAANAVLKEARDIKHKANRLKNEGLDHDSISLYFQSALKFLQGASLLELPSSENARQGEINPSMQMMQMYSDTARLCEYCAQDYERCKEMAAAALAYKCVEVAYMKVAYYKHAGASKDRQELVMALQTGLPGESPSSSASDIDNLNNQSALDKAISVKAVNSPQIAGNHVISARNRPNFLRLLSYTNDLNCAFDATKRSQSSIAAAGVSLEKDEIDGLSSVRKVLDFNFHNVEGFLRLVRLSLESISR